MYTLEKKKGKAGFMIIKIDLEKVYDRMEWSFVRSMMYRLGFHGDTVELILSCISSTSMALLFNGSQMETFHPSRRLRQGDPISPYIFVLCMEFLSSLINKKCEDGKWNKVKASRGRPRFSHTFFVNDLLLYAKADHGNSEAIVEVLDELCALTGQKISKEKIKIFFYPNTTIETKEEIMQLLGISETPNIGKYLGSLSCIKVEVVMIFNLWLRESKLSWLVGKLNSFPLQEGLCSLR